MKTTSCKNTAKAELIEQLRKGLENITPDRPLTAKEKLKALRGELQKDLERGYKAVTLVAKLKEMGIDVTPRALIKVCKPQRKGKRAAQPVAKLAPPAQPTV